MRPEALQPDEQDTRDTAVKREKPRSYGALTVYGAEGGT